MSINFTAKNVKLTGALKAFAAENLKTIEKISGDIIDAEIIVHEEKLDFKVELIVKTKLHSYQISDKDPILKQAVRKTLNTLKARAKKNKDKLKIDKKRTTKADTIKHMPPAEDIAAEPAPAADTDITSIAGLTISENFSRKPLSVEEAVFFLKDSGENAYMFTNVETNKMSVVFVNKEEKISIIEEV